MYTNAQVVERLVRRAQIQPRGAALLAFNMRAYRSELCDNFRDVS
jgi:hypothetical protein